MSKISNKITPEDLELGTLEHPRGILREALKMKMKKGRDPRKAKNYPGFIPSCIADNGALTIDPIWYFVDPEELKGMWEEIDKEREENKRKPWIWPVTKELIKKICRCKDIKDRP